jgi:hypothetical protein
MSQELSTRLAKIVEQKRLKVKTEQDLRAVEEEYRDQSARLEMFAAKLEKEKIDVEKLERTSLTSLFYSVLGNREQQLDKERQESLAAQLLYQQTKHQVSSLGQERSSLLKRLAGLQSVDSEYELLLSEKEQFLRQSDQPAARELIELSEQVADHNSELKEIGEAVLAGKSVISELEKVIESLENAESWGTWDLLGGGLLSTALKHSNIDNARSGIAHVQEKMSLFTRELADVRKAVELDIDVDGYSTFADYFFDGLIIDWVVQSEIVASLKRTRQARKLIAQAIVELKNLRGIARAKINDLQEKRRLLIEGA